MREKRNSNRTIMAGKVTLRPENNPAEAVMADLVNISYGGICCHSGKALEAGMLVQFELTTECLLAPLCGKGKISSVIEAKRYGTTYFRIGIDFVEVNKSMVLAIMNSRVSRRPPSSPPGATTFDFPA
jgi:hypothetical protein